MNSKKICTACGTQFPQNNPLPVLCPICDDDRQSVPGKGQGWTDGKELSATHHILITPLANGLYSLKLTPSFALEQRALLVITPGGNILWDCLPLLDEPTITFIRQKGGLKAIAISHPHYYGAMNDWAEKFDCPVYVHRLDEQWIVNKGPQLQPWEGQQKELWDGITLYNIGGHFPGSCIIRVPALSHEGAVLVGDTIYVAPSKRHMAVMFSFPNRIPLPIKEVQRVGRRMAGIPFDTLFGSYDWQNIHATAKALLATSMERYV